MEEELKEKLAALIEDAGMSSKDFMTDLVQGYELHKAKEAVPILGADIDELQTLTNRINAVFLNITERVNTLMASKNEQFQEKINQKDEAIEVLLEKSRQMEIEKINFADEQEGLQKLNQKLNDDLAKLEKDLNAKTEQFAAANESSKALIEEYRSKIDTLSGLLDEYKAAKEERDVLQDNLNRERKTVEELESGNREKDRQIQRMDEELKEAQAKHDLELKEADKKRSFEMERMAGQEELAREKAVLALEKHHQAEKKQMQDEYSIKVRELLERLEQQGMVEK